MRILPRLVFTSDDELRLESNTPEAVALVGPRRWLLRVPRTWSEKKIRREAARILRGDEWEGSRALGWEKITPFPEKEYLSALGWATPFRAEWFRGEKVGSYLRQAMVQVEKARLTGKRIFPSPEKVLRAFDETPLGKVRVILIGQDPYHGVGQATGLAFSIESGWPPSSLTNIFKELESDIGPIVSSAIRRGDLSQWARSGVLLLNTALTVEAGEAGSHLGVWRSFTRELLGFINSQLEFAVLLLWGAKAAELGSLLSLKRFPRVQAAHPSGLSAHKGFFGSRCFSQVNQILVDHSETPIDWTGKSSV